MEYSLPAWLGALAGTVVAVVIYLPVIRLVERRMRGQSGPMTLEQRAAFEDKLSVVRRLILGLGIAILATLGYWIGNAIGAAGAPPPLR
jgi:membrane associated rhomboid family serine protease